MSKILKTAILIYITIQVNAQTIEWESTFSSNEFGERIKDLTVTSNKDLLCVGWSSPNSNPEPSMLKFDSIGNFKWFQRLQFDSLESGNFNFIKDIPGEKDFYYVGGSSYELGVWNNDFIAKIDTSGDTLWCKFYHYPTFYGTTLNAIVLKDKSLVTIGVIQTASFYDIIARRIDSLGNTLWENIFNMPGEQNGFDLVEMMDGSIILAGNSDGDNLIIRIGFAGSPINQTLYNNSSDVRGAHLNLIRDNAVFQTGFGNSPVLSFKNFNIYKDSGYLSLQSIPYSTTSSLIFQDSNVLFSNFFDDTLRLIYADLYSRNYNWEISFGDINSNFKSIEGIEYYSHNHSLIFGLFDSANTQNYWLAKISGVGEKWIPDRCAYQPPIAGFEYEYNYPLLTLRDTSSGGLKYLDTVYTWQWSTSLGTTGTDDSLLVFFDTAINKTIDIELVISNWYGCTDTIYQTLNFNPSGITTEQPFEFKIYPNPVSDYLNIEFTETPKQDVLFELFDIQGVKRKSSHLNGVKSDNGIRIADLRRGIYFYRISSGNQLKRGKLVIK